ncbi:hypothetical protein [Paractinoplanes toevensis]|nr:hypothetical protein [Actinoplanes toevensis]
MRPAEMIDVELTVADSQQSPTLAEVSRAVVSVAASLVTNVQRAVVGPTKVPTARDNAYFAMLADRARNQARDDLTREVAALLAATPTRTRKLARTR